MKAMVIGHFGGPLVVWMRASHTSSHRSSWGGLPYADVSSVLINVSVRKKKKKGQNDCVSTHLCWVT